MKKLALWAALAAIGLASVADARAVRVKGYFRKDGTYVAPHVRSAPNSSKLDNYSTKGNVNPYTGKEGTVEPWPGTPPSPPAYPVYTSPNHGAYSIKPTVAPIPAPLYTAEPAASAPRSIAIFGKGPSINCGDWIASAESETHADGLAWLMGFYSAASIYAADKDDFTDGTGADGLYAASMEMCRKNPAITLNYAGDAIVRAFALTQGDRTP